MYSTVQQLLQAPPEMSITNDNYSTLHDTAMAPFPMIIAHERSKQYPYHDRLQISPHKSTDISHHDIIHNCNIIFIPRWLISSKYLMTHHKFKRSREVSMDFAPDFTGNSSKSRLQE